jgi:hypothetical protein
VSRSYNPELDDVAPEAPPSVLLVLAQRARSEAELLRRELKSRIAFEAIHVADPATVGLSPYFDQALRVVAAELVATLFEQAARGGT